MFVNLKDVIGLRFTHKEGKGNPRELSVVDLTQPSWIGPVLKVLASTDKEAFEQFGANELEGLKAFVNSFAALAAAVQTKTLKVPLTIELILQAGQ